MLFVGGTIAVIVDGVNHHNREMQRIKNLREETVRKLKNKRQKEIHKHKEFQEVCKLFQLQVEQAKRLITEAEYTDRNGRKIKGYNGRTFSRQHDI